MKRGYLLHGSLVGFVDKKSGYKGTYHFHGKTGNCVWLAPFGVGNFSGNAIFLIFSVFSADLDIRFSGSFSHLAKFYSYAQDFHTDVLCNGKHPRIK